MASCDSATKAVVNLWNEYGEIAKKLGCVAAGVAVGIATSNPQAALKTIQEALEAADKVEDAIRKAESAYAGVIGRTSGLTIGPRLLRLDTWESGTIVSTGERLFLTAAPMNRDTATLRLSEQGGKGKVSVTVCAFNADTEHKKLVDIVVNEDKDDKRDKNEQRTIPLKGIEDRWISIHIDGKSVANTFKYKLMLDV